MDKNLVYGPLQLPSGKKIKFRAAKGIDRANVLQMMKIDTDSAISGALLLDDYVKAKCVTEVDGVTTTGEYKTLLNNWLDSDITFYKAVVNEMFGGGQEVQDKAKEAARFLLNPQISTDGCNAPITQGVESDITNG